MPPYRLAIPILLVGVIIAAYWFRVVRMARKARLRTGRAANFLPREPLGRALRVLWVPAVVVWIAHPFYVALAMHPPAALRPLWASAVSAWMGSLGALACFLATRACWRRMGAAWRMGIDPGETTPLVTSGFFAYVRHPIYTLSAAMMLSTLLAVPTPLMAAAAAVHIVLLGWEARREERHLDRVHGEPYRRYRARVGQLVPRSWRPYRAPEADVPR